MSFIKALRAKRSPLHSVFCVAPRSRKGRTERLWGSHSWREGN